MADIVPDKSAGIGPGYHRRIIVVAQAFAVAAMLEDDFHCMSVTLRHDGTRVTTIETLFERAPWTTCPGALAKLEETFTGQPLVEVTARREKKQNCTHLHDMAVLAASHAASLGETVFDIFTADPVDGARILELRRNGQRVLFWHEEGGVLTSPAAVAGKTLFSLREWIATLSGDEQEAVRLLQWAGMVAHGRTVPMAQQSNASAMPPNCYTFQPERAVHAKLIGVRRDFSNGDETPLDDMAAKVLATL